MRRIPQGAAAMVGRRLTPEPERPLPTDPVEWVRSELDESLWSMQRRIMEAVVAHRKVAVQSCHQIGKSYIAARVGAWWIAAHPMGEAQIVSTAPSSHQVRAILWKELQRAHVRGSLPGFVTRGQIPEWIIGDEQVGFGRKPSDYVDVEQARTQFQGIHARYLLGLLDEGCGVPTWLWEAMDTLVTNENSRLLAIGNPDDPTTHFAKVCAPGSGWHVIEVSAFDSPNFTDEPVPEQLHESLISPMWVEEVERDYGAESAFYTSKVLGQFPDIADDVIIPPRLVREAHERDLSGKALTDRGRYGMDVARFGKDETAIYLNRGGMIRLVESWRKQDTTASMLKAKAVLDSTGDALPMQIDVVGLGAGVYDPLAHMGYRVRPFGGGEKAHNAERFTNRNAEAWWAFRKGLEDGLIDLDPEDEDLAAQLQSRKWREDASGRRIEVERKEHMESRGIRSPDRADAAILSFYDAVRTVTDVSQFLERRAWEPEATIAGDLLTLKT